MMMAKGIALSLRKSFWGINHLEGHALTPRLTHNVPFPYLLLLASGGHCQILEVIDVGHYKILGQTIDDAAGEAFDKVAKMLGLDYPGGPSIERHAEQGDPKRFSFPIPLQHHPIPNFSFSGLKTSVRTCINRIGGLSEQDIADVAASFQKTVVDIFLISLKKVLRSSQKQHKHLVISGGVAANKSLRKSLEEFAQSYDLCFYAPPVQLCTDNAAMIGWAAIERMRKCYHPDGLNLTPKPRWPLDSLSV
jgi:N6-L-threonylcarbamoyladenine synthase